MPRRARIHLDGVPLHIVQRGHNREPCFFAEEDYHAGLGAALQREGCALHAYALMTNHAPKRAESVPRLIIALGRRYVQYINTTYRRTGTLWDSRYKSSLIQAETYLLACMRYVELNPVRATMVDDPAHYRWTSYPIRLALNQNQPLGNHRFYAKIEKLTGERREAKPRGRPRVLRDDNPDATHRQGKLEI